MADPVNDYFNTRIAQELETNAQFGISTAYDELEAARADKINKLEAKRVDLERIRKINEASLAAKLGYDPGSIPDAVVATLVAPAAVVTEGAATALDAVAKVSPADAAETLRSYARQARDANTQLESKVAINPETGERTSGLQRRVADGAVLGAQGVMGALEVPVGLASMVSGGKAGQLAEEVGFRPREASQIMESWLSPEMQAVNKAVEDADGFGDTVNAMLENPSSIVGGIIKSLPSMVAGGAIGKAITKLAPAVSAGLAGSIGEGVVMAGAQAENIRAQTDDKTLDFKQSLLAAATGVAGTVVGRVGNKAAGKLGVGDIEESLVTGTLAKPRHSIAGNTILTGAVEGGEELLQSSAEQMLSNEALGRPLMEGVGDAAAIGLLTGAPMGGLAGAAQGAREVVAKAAAEDSSKAAVDAAIASGDISAFLDDEKATFAPEKAVQVLLARSKLAETTAEQREANLVQAGEIVEDQRQTLDLLRETRATMEANDAPAAAKAGRDAAIRKTEERLKAAEATMQAFTQETAPEIDVTTEAEVANKADPVESQAAATKIIQLSMASPTQVDASTAAILAGNESNGLTAEQRSYLRTFSQARIEQNKAQSMSDVNKEIVFGSKGTKNRPAQKGILQYRANLASAVASNNQAAADRELNGLKSFQADQASKLAAVEAANTEFQQTGKPVQAIRTATGKWEINRGPMLGEAEARANGAITIHSGTKPTFLQNMKAGSVAVDAGVAELESAYNLKFGQSEGPNNVQDVSQPQGAESKGQSSSDPVQATEASPSSGTSTGGLPGAVVATAAEAQTSTVETQEASASTVVSEEGTAAENTAEAVNTPSVENTLTDGNAASADNVTNVPEAAPKAYQERDLIADFAQQSASREGDKTQRPLAAVKNFLSEQYSRVLEFTGLNEFTNEQRNLLQVFSEAAKAWSPALLANLVREKNPAFFHKDPIQFLIQEQDGKPVLEENVLTAMAYAAFSYVSEQATKSMWNTDEEINATLLRDETTNVDEYERSILGHVGPRLNVVVNSLGQRAVQALGYKFAKNTPADVRSNLEASLGSHVMKMMLDQGILERTSIDGKVMAALMGRKDTNAEAQYYFLRLARKDGQLNAEAEQIYQANRKTSNVLDKLFGVESGLKEPSTEPIKFNQATTRNTSQAVPKAQAKLVQKQNNIPSFLRQDMWQLVSSLPEEIVLALAGVTEVNDSVHPANQRSLQAKNDGIRREVERFIDYVSSMKDQAAGMYFEHTVWKQQRVGIATNVVNPQTSKVHRFMLYRQSWNTKVDMSNQKQMDNYRLRVLEGLGVKTDKQTNEASLASYDAKVNDPKIQAAVDVLVASFDGTLTEDQQQALVAGVSAGGANFHSLDALMALAHEKWARDKGETSFEVQMMGEIDGVTNGPMLSHLMMGAAATAKDLFALLNRGGFFEEGNTFKNYNQWRAQKTNNDLYETTAKNMVQETQNLISTGVLNRYGKVEIAGPVVAKTLNAIYAFTGALTDANTGAVAKEGRNIVKTPLTAMVFGSAVPKAVDSMANKFIESVYAKIEDIASGKSEMTLETVHSHLKTLGVTYPVAEMMTRELKFNEIEILKESFSKTLGKAVSNTMEKDFAVFINQRKQLVKASELAFEMYNATFVAVRDQFMNELMDREANSVGSGVAFAVSPKTGARIPRHDLTNDQLRELKTRLIKAAPVMHTLFSKESNQLAAGLYMSKSGRKLSDRPMYQLAPKFGVPFKDNKASSIKTRGYEVEETAPGVAMAPMSVHSLDSFISHTAADLSEVLNIHDAHGAGLSNFTEAAQNLNAATWTGTFKYSPLGEAYAALSRTVQGLAELAQSENLPPEARAGILTAIAKVAAKHKEEAGTFLNDLMVGTKAAAFHADAIKFEVMSQLRSIDQYALEDGEYTVTALDRAAAKAALDSLEMNLTPAETSAIEVIQNLEATAAKVEAEQTVDLDASIADAQVYDLQPVRVMQLLDALTLDMTLPAALRDKLYDVMGNIEAKMSLKDAILKDRPAAEAAQIVQLLNQRYAAMQANSWAELGHSSIASDPRLVEMFETNTQVSAQMAIRKLHEIISQAPQNNVTGFNLKLLALLNRSVNPNLLIKYMTPVTAAATVLGKPVSGARGWYTYRGNQDEIFVLSPDYKHSGLTAETLLHELTHSVLARMVDAELAAKKANPKYTSETLDLINELEELRTKAQKFVAANSIEGFSAALTDVHELISWGMTNLDFQRNVLNKISMTSKTSGNQLVSGMKKFIDTVVGILFKGSAKTEQQLATNGLSVLIGNVSGLFNGAKATNSTSSGTFAQASAALSFTTLEILDALDQGKLTQTFNEHLKEVLGTVVNKLHVPGGIMDLAKSGQATSAFDVWMKAKATGLAPFASKVMAGPLVVSEQEAFAIEQVEGVMRATLEDNEANSKTAYRELSKLFEEVRTKLAGQIGQGTWTQAKHDFVFKIEQRADGRSDYLARFAALAIAHQEFNGLLTDPTNQAAPVVAGSGFVEQITAIFNRVLEFLSTKITGTFAGQPANDKIMALASNLVDIEAKKRAKLAIPASSVMANIEERVKQASDTVRAKIGDAAGSDFFRENRSEVVKLAGTVARVVTNDRVDEFMAAIQGARDQHFGAIQGLGASLINEYRGATEFLQKLLRETKNHERLRKSEIVNYGKAVLAGFEQKLSDDAKKAITKVFLRTGLHSLLSSYDMAQIKDLLSSPVALDAEIKKLEAQLTTFGKAQSNYFIRQADATGHHVVTGGSKSPILMKNAYNISRMLGVPSLQGTLTDAQMNQAEEIIKQLVSLHGIHYSNDKTIAAALAVLEIENRRGDKNGVEFVLKLHKQLEQESLTRLFKGNKVQMIHGFVPEIYNPHTQVRTAGKDEGQALIDLGYTQGLPVAADPADPTREVRHVYVLRDGGPMPYLTAGMSLTSMKARGTPLHDGFMGTGTLAGLTNLQTMATMAANKAPMIQQFLNSNAQSKNNHMVPTLDEQGNITNWAYMMQEETKDELLDRNNNVDKVLGALAGSIYDKETSREQNKKIVQALYDQAQEEAKDAPDSYHIIGPNSPDPALREIWAMLPEETKQDVKTIWKKTDGLKVRVDQMDIVFGYRKLSLAKAFATARNERERMRALHGQAGGIFSLEDIGFLEKLFVGVIENMFTLHARAILKMTPEEAERWANRAALYVTKGERAWQEIVHEIKDIFVVKSGVVLLGNMYSNVSLLMLQGVPMKDIVRHHVVAVKATTAYQQDMAELSQLKILRDTGYMQGQDDEIAHKIARLEDAIARNPVRELIDRGLLPTIVEDVAADEDIYSYKSALARKTDRFTSKLPAALRNAGKQVYMTHDTGVYKVLSRTTQLSDFVARYTLVQHLTNQKKPLDIETAVQKASDAFVNYDIPMHRGLQYSDDMGLTMFSKYILRIQKVLLDTARENPARVLMTAAIGQFLDLGPIVLDSSAIARIGNNPFNIGALQYPTSLDNLMTVDVSLGLLN